MTGRDGIVVKPLNWSGLKGIITPIFFDVRGFDLPRGDVGNVVALFVKIIDGRLNDGAVGYPIMKGG